MEHYIRNEAEMSQDAPNHTKNKTRKLPVPHRTRLTPAAREALLDALAHSLHGELLAAALNAREAETGN